MPMPAEDSVQNTDAVAQKTSLRCKLCLVCSLGVAVAVAVGIPIGVFVVGPKIAQIILDHSTIALPNLTQAACPQNYTWLFNSAQITVPSIGPIKLTTTIEKFTQETWTTACINETTGLVTPAATCGDENAKEHRMGYYPSPVMAVKSGGDTFKNFTVIMNSDSEFILQAWVVPLWLASQKTRLILKASDVTVNVLGLRFHGLTMRNEMTCTGTSPLTPHPMIDVPASVCYPNDPKATSYQTQAYPAVCVAGRHSIAPTTTTTTSASAFSSQARMTTKKEKEPHTVIA